MDEFNYNSSYSSGWKHIKREENEKEQQIVYGIHQKNTGVLTNISKQIADNTLPMNIKATENTSSFSFEENQKEIIDKINQLQAEITTMKQLLSDIQTNTEIIKVPNHKNATGSKLSRLFK
ncbi:MAG: hypothetical protein GX386_08025 [Clostridiaceae bacterium]|jgi:hypothetical protein|nr:hypothetical protein [Clostridiaceae bacterium]